MQFASLRVGGVNLTHVVRSRVESPKGTVSAAVQLLLPEPQAASLDRWESLWDSQRSPMRFHGSPRDAARIEISIASLSDNRGRPTVPPRRCFPCASQRPPEKVFRESASV